MCSPLGRRAKGPPSFAESNDNRHTNHTDSHPNHSPPHSLPPIATGVFGGKVHLPSLPSIQQMLLADCLLPRRRVGPLLEVQLIQQYNFKAANHLRIIPPIQTSRPDYGKKIHTHFAIFRNYFAIFSNYFAIFGNYFVIFRNYFAIFRNYSAIFRDYSAIFRKPTLESIPQNFYNILQCCNQFA